MPDNDDDIKYSELNGVQRHIGSVSGYNLITTDKDPSTYPIFEHAYTLPEFLAQLRDHKSKMNMKKLIDLMKMIADHIYDYDNPHKVTLESLGTDVMQELYKEYLAYTGKSKDDVSELTFLKIIFQYVKIADLQTTLEGTARDQVPTVYGMTEAIKKHDKDPEAHSVLFNKLFPGDPIFTDPSLAAHGYLGLPYMFTVERATQMCYIDSIGRIALAAANTMPCDFTFKDGAFPIFGALTNIITGNTDIAAAGQWSSSNLTLSSYNDSSTGLSNGITGKILRLKESTDASPVEHNLIYTGTASYAANAYYTLAFFVKPLYDTNDMFGVRLTDVFQEPYSFIHFDVRNKKIFKHDSITDDELSGGITEVANGWFRVWLTFKPTVAHVINFKFYPIDIYDGDFSYKGTGQYVFDFAYPQLTATDNIVPPIIASVANTVDPTYVSLKFSDVYLKGFNPNAGTFVFDSTYPKGQTSTRTQSLYDITTDTNIAAMSGKYPTNHRSRLYALFNSSTGGTLGYNYLDCDPAEDFARFVVGYSPTQFMAGSAKDSVVSFTTIASPVNPSMSMLYLGCDRYKTANSVLNGYVRKITYYPMMATEKQAIFLLGE